MTTVYKFKSGYTKLGVATAPASAPTFSAVDSSDNLLVNAQATSALVNLPGAYLYEYSGADGLDLVGKFSTTDATMDGQDLFSIPDAFTVSDIWAALLTGITTAGSIGKLIKDYLDAAVSSRSTPASPVASTAAIVSGSNITILRGDNMALTFTDLGSLASVSKLYFTVKTRSDETDAKSAIQIERTAGLVYINGQASTAGNGVLTITDATDGDITVTLTAAEVAKLALYTYMYDVQLITAAGVVSTLTSGNLTVSGDITHAVA